MKRFFLWILKWVLLIGVMFTIFWIVDDKYPGFFDSTTPEDMTCDDLANRLKGEEVTSVFGKIEILKFSDVRQVKRISNPLSLICSANGTTSIGRDISFTLSLETDEDGDTFFGMEANLFD
tara:strand:- start:62 stop:424 length:363 start_codon:yes stop_codon:yes gene_type:complete